MSQEYVGYAFSTSDISGEGFLHFMKTHDPDRYHDMVSDKFGGRKNPDTLTEDELEELAAAAEDWIDFNTFYGFKADYVAGIMCDKTCEGLFYALDGDYVVYPPLRFPDDATEEKCRFIKNSTDLEKLVSSFFPGEKINFGNLYEGSEDWIDPNYFMD